MWEHIQNQLRPQNIPDNPDMIATEVTVRAASTCESAHDVSLVDVVFSYRYLRVVVCELRQETIRL